MSTFNLIVDNKKMRFSTQISPYVFQESTELVKNMVEEANSTTEQDRIIIIDYNSEREHMSFKNSCINLIGCLSVIGIPFLCYYNINKTKKYKKALENIEKKWEDIANRYNEKLIQKGAHVRYASITKVVVGSQEYSYNEYTYYYEFTFQHNNNLNQAVILNQNNLNNIPPPTEMQKFIAINEARKQ